MISINSQVLADVARPASLGAGRLQAEQAGVQAPRVATQEVDAAPVISQQAVSAPQAAEEAKAEEKRSKGNGFLSRFANRVQEGFSAVKEKVNQGISVAQGVVDRVKQAGASIANEVRQGVERIKEPVAELSNRLGQLKDTAVAMKDSAVSLVKLGVSTAVSVGEGVLKAGASIAAGVASVGQAFSSGKTFGERAYHLSEGVSKLAGAIDPLKNSWNQIGAAREEGQVHLGALKDNWTVAQGQMAGVKEQFQSVKAEAAMTWQAVRQEGAQASSDISALLRPEGAAGFQQLA